MADSQSEGRGAPAQVCYVLAQEISAWGDELVEFEDHQRACKRMQDWLTDHEGDELCIAVRPTHINEAPGLYEVTSGGNLRPVQPPASVRILLDQAFEYACETWDGEVAR